MGTLERRQRHDDELRRRILDIAEGLFAEEGYDNVSMRKIAAAIEYAPTAIYRLFGSKAAIMDELIARGYRGVRERYRQVLAEGAGREPASQLSDLIAAYVEFALEHPRHYELWFSSGAMEVVDGALRLQHGGASYTVYQPWLELIEGCRGAGAFAGRSNLEVFLLLWPAVHGVISLRIRHPGLPWSPLSTHLAALLGVAGLDVPSGGDPSPPLE